MLLFRLEVIPYAQHEAGRPELRGQSYIARWKPASNIGFGKERNPIRYAG